MTPAAQRQAIVEILTLLAKLNDEPEGKRFGARVAIALIEAGKIKQAVDSLRQSKHGVLSSMSWEVEAFLLKAEARR
jgi:hypothetical protein